MYAANYLERFEGLPPPIFRWKTLLNFSQATVEKLRFALLSLYLQGEKPLAIKACHKTLSHPDSEPLDLAYIADAFDALCLGDDATNALYRIFSHPNSVKEDFDGAINSDK